MQAIVALFFLRTTAGQWSFQFLADQAVALLSRVHAGSSFVFGPDYDQYHFAMKVSESMLDCTVKLPEWVDYVATLHIPTHRCTCWHVLQVLPSIIYVSAFMSCAYYVGVLKVSEPESEFRN